MVTYLTPSTDVPVSYSPTAPQQKTVAQLGLVPTTPSPYGVLTAPSPSNPFAVNYLAPSTDIPVSYDVTSPQGKTVEELGLVPSTPSPYEQAGVVIVPGGANPLETAEQKIMAVGPMPSREGAAYNLTSEENAALMEQQIQEAVVGYMIVGSVVAPVVSPVVTIAGVGVNVALASGGIGLGVSQAIKAAQGGGLLTPQEAITAFGASAVFAVASGGVASLVQSAGVGTVTGIALRGGANALIGGGIGYVASGGKTESALLGAALAGGGSVAFDVVRLGVIPKTGVLKYGEVHIPLEYEQEVTWKGLYISKGENVLGTWGKWSLPEGMEQLGAQVPKGVAATYLTPNFGMPTTLAEPQQGQLFGALATRSAITETAMAASRLYGIGMPEITALSKSAPLIKGHGLTGEERGWWPSTNIEAAITVKLMEKLGYPTETLTDIAQVRATEIAFQKVQPKNIEDFLPTKTRTLSEAGVTESKAWMLEHKGEVELFGKYAAIPQEAKTFEYTKTIGGETTSALRTTSDIDIKLSVGEEKAIEFTTGLLERLRSVGESVRVSATKPTLIESEVSPGVWSHAIDIKYPGMPLEAGDLITSGKSWGITIEQKPIKIEGISSQALGEQLVSKGQSILGFTEEAYTGKGTLGPVTHRAAKDVVDFFQDARTLIEAKGVPVSETHIPRLTERYGVTDLLKTPIPPIQETYFVSPTVKSAKPSYTRPILISPSSFPSLISVSAKAPSVLYDFISPSVITKSGVPSILSGKSPSSMLKGLSVPSIAYPSPSPIKLSPSDLISSYAPSGIPSIDISPSSFLKIPSPSLPSPSRVPSPLKYPYPSFDIPTGLIPTPWSPPSSPPPSSPPWSPPSSPPPSSPPPSYPPPPSIPNFPNFPSFDFDLPKGRGLKSRKQQGHGLYLWEFPVKGPKAVFKFSLEGLPSEPRKAKRHRGKK